MSAGAGDELPPLLRWVHTCDGISKPPSKLGDLADGITFAEILASIAPSVCDVESLETDPGEHKLLRASNVGIVITGLRTFVEEELGHEDAPLSGADATRIGRDVDEAAITALLSYLLAAAVQGPDRSKHIEAIMGMDGDAQKALQTAIQTGMQGFQADDDVSAADDGSVGEGDGVLSDSGTEDAGQVSPLAASPSDGGRERQASDASSSSADRQYSRESKQVVEQLRRQLRISELEVARFRDERDDLFAKLGAVSAEKRALEEVAAIRSTGEAAGSREYVERRTHDLNEQLKAREEELAQLEARSAARVRRLEEQLAQQADELDVANDKLAGLASLEAQLDKYKSRVAVVAQLRANVKQLEEEKAGYFEKILDLESELTALPKLRSQLQAYKDRVVDLETSQAGEKEMVAVKEAEIGRLQSVVSELRERVGFLDSDLEEAKNKVLGLQQTDTKRHDSDEEESVAPLIPAEITERLARLERENKVLREAHESDTSGGAGSGESADVELLRSQLDDSERVKTKLTETARSATLRIAELEQELTEAKSGAVGDNAALRRANDELSAELDRVKTQLSETRSASEAQQVQANITVRLKQQIKEKDKQLDETQTQLDKYKRGCERTMELLKKKSSELKLRMKEQQAEVALRANLELKVREQQRELRLVMSSFYKLGADRQRSLLQPAGSGESSSASWLASARHARRFGEAAGR